MKETTVPLRLEEPGHADSYLEGVLTLTEIHKQEDVSSVWPGVKLALRFTDCETVNSSFWVSSLRNAQRAQCAQSWGLAELGASGQLPVSPPSAEMQLRTEQTRR